MLPCSSLSNNGLKLWPYKPPPVKCCPYKKKTYAAHNGSAKSWSGNTCSPSASPSNPPLWPEQPSTGLLNRTPAPAQTGTRCSQPETPILNFSLPQAWDLIYRVYPKGNAKGKAQSFSPCTQCIHKEWNIQVTDTQIIHTHRNTVRARSATVCLQCQHLGSRGRRILGLEPSGLCRLRPHFMNFQTSN